MNLVTKQINQGITPRALEWAYGTNTVRELAEFYDLSKEEVVALAKRWGIGPYREAK